MGYLLISILALTVGLIIGLVVGFIGYALVQTQAILDGNKDVIGKLQDLINSTNE